MFEKLIRESRRCLAAKNEAVNHNTSEEAVIVETNELLLQIINEIKEFKQDTQERFDRIEKKLNLAITQTAELTEFRTEANTNFDKLLD